MADAVKVKSLKIAPTPEFSISELTVNLVPRRVRPGGALFGDYPQLLMRK